MSTSLVLAQTAQGVAELKWTDNQFGQTQMGGQSELSTRDSADLSRARASGPSLRDPALLLCDFPDLLLSQEATGYSTARTSDTSPGYAVADNFTGIYGPIESLHFWGLSLSYPWAACTETHRFNIKIYGSAGTMPDYSDVICQWTNVLPNAQVDTGEDFGSAGYPIWRWDINALNPSCGPLSPTTEYWVEIVGASTPATCWFMWIDSADGDTKAYQQGSSSPILLTSQSMCIDGDTTTVGSCCDDSTGECLDNIPITECLGAFDRWTPGVACAALIPACGLATGACCYDDGNCDDTLTYDACVGGKTTGPRWLGAGTTCDQCCTVPCPPGGILEGEPEDCPVESCIGDCNCDGWVDLKDINPFAAGLASPSTQCNPLNFDINGDGLTDLRDINPFVALLATGGIPFPCSGRGDRDDFNGGCNSDPPIFSPIACGQTICGESGTFFVEDPNDPGWFFATRDMDWYELTVNDPAQFTMTIEAEFPVRAWIVQSDNGACDGTTLLTDAVADCTELTLTTACLPEETYWFIVAPNTFTGVLCGSDYTVTLDCVVPCETCDVECPLGGVFEAEDCGEDTNGGCDSDPPAFETIECGVDYCGTIWADGGTRDTDWYELTITPEMGLTELFVSYIAEFPSRVGFSSDGSGDITDPTCDGGFHYGFDLPTPCDEVVSNSFGQRPPGFYWFVPLIDDGAGIFEGYPCGLLNDYTFRIDCESISCDDLLFCFPGEPTTEDDPGCGPGYVDAYNGGCDAPTFHALDVACDEIWCGDTGAWGTGKDYDWYRITLTEPTRLFITMTTEATMRVNIVDLAGGCPGDVIESRYVVDGCVIGQSFATRCLDSGEYYIRVFPNLDDNVTCGLNYDMLIECGECTYPCAVTCTGDDEGETCGEQINGGCFGNNQFSTMQCNVAFCGELFADAGDQDDDWMQLEVTTTSYLQITQEHEMPAEVWLFPNACDDLSGSVVWSVDCNPVTWLYEDEVGTQVPVNPGETITFLIRPSDGINEIFFEDYPCGDLNDYSLLVECQSTPW